MSSLEGKLLSVDVLNKKGRGEIQEAPSFGEKPIVNGKYLRSIKAAALLPLLGAVISPLLCLVRLPYLNSRQEYLMGLEPQLLKSIHLAQTFCVM